MNCIFGLFDVLGFTSFCENCDLQKAEEVLKIMDDFDTDIPKMVWASPTTTILHHQRQLKITTEAGC